MTIVHVYMPREEAGMAFVAATTAAPLAATTPPTLQPTLLLLHVPSIPARRPNAKPTQRLWVLKPRTLEFGNSSLPELHVAYCDYDGSRQWFHSRNFQEFYVEWVGPLLGRHYHVKVRNVYAKVSHLPPGVDANSSDGLHVLGIAQTHLRICYFGNTELIEHMTSLPGIGLGHVSGHQAMKRILAVNGLWQPKLARRMRLPHQFHLVMNVTSGKPFGPLLFRRSQESFHTQVEGVPMQIETKWEGGPLGAATFYLPFLVDSFSWRWKNPRKTGQVWESKMGAEFATMEETVTRPAGFEPVGLEQKKEFCATLVSHCEGNPSIAVREAFTYAVWRQTGKKVWNLGACPEGEDGAIKAGVTVAERDKMKERFKGKSATEVFREFRFGIVFENSFLRGYFTEKLVSPYAAQAVPVYYAETVEDLKELVDLSAIVYCYMPREMTGPSFLGKVGKQVCAGLKEEDKECSRRVREKYVEVLGPYFENCTRRMVELERNEDEWNKVVRRDLAVREEDGRLGEMWQADSVADAFRAVMVGVGYLQR